MIGGDLVGNIGEVKHLPTALGKRCKNSIDMEFSKYSEGRPLAGYVGAGFHALRTSRRKLR